MIVGIVAVAENLAIGKNGKLPWHYSADLKHFKETTTGHTVVMGSRTWQSIRHPLPNRQNVVLSRSEIPGLPEGIILCHSKNQVFERAERWDGDIFIMGGAEVFASFKDDIRRWIVTRVPLRVEDADAFMPENFLNGYILKQQKDLGEGLRVEVFERAGT
jgi:dihydrofolate reductase